MQPFDDMSSIFLKHGESRAGKVGKDVVGLLPGLCAVLEMLIIPLIGSHTCVLEIMYVFMTACCVYTSIHMFGEH